MIYSIIGLITAAMACLSEAKEKTKKAWMSIGAALFAVPLAIAMICVAGGPFDRARAEATYEAATYLGGDRYSSRYKGEFEVKVENPEKKPLVGEAVYLCRYSDQTYAQDLAYAPWRLFRERWYIA